MTITVSCPSCSTAFPVDPEKVPEGGVNARCSECTAVFFVEKPAQFEVPEAAEPTPEQVTTVPETEIPEVQTEGVAEVQATPEEAQAGDPVAESTEVVEEEPEAPAEERWGVVEEEPESSAEESWGTGEETAATGEAEAPSEAPDDEGWMIEREPERETDIPDVEPIETVASAQQDSVEEAEEEAPAEEPDVTGGFEEADAGARAGEGVPGLAAPGVPDEVEEWEPVEEPEPGEGQVPDALAAEAEEEAPAPKGFQFGKRDPHDKARRLARVLVSDMIMYNPERHQRALEQGSLHADFEDEIQKSWEEYIEQVGEEIANETSYFNDALNDILAKGEQVFHGQPGG